MPDETTKPLTDPVGQMQAHEHDAVAGVTAHESRLAKLEDDLKAVQARIESLVEMLLKVGHVAEDAGTVVPPVTPPPTSTSEPKT